MSAQLTLAAFIEARLAEDEAAAKRNATAWDEAEDWVRYEWDDVPDSIAELYSRFGSARVLREVEAKRKILRDIVPELERYVSFIDSEYNSEPDYGDEDLLKIMAAVWSDHPGYQQDWA